MEGKLDVGHIYQIIYRNCDANRISRGAVGTTGAEEYGHDEGIYSRAAFAVFCGEQIAAGPGHGVPYRITYSRVRRLQGAIERIAGKVGNTYTGVTRRRVEFWQAAIEGETTLQARPQLGEYTRDFNRFEVNDGEGLGYAGAYTRAAIFVPREGCIIRVIYSNRCKPKLNRRGVAHVEGFLMEARIGEGEVAVDVFYRHPDTLLLGDRETADDNRVGAVQAGIG